ncbi:NAD(P)-dependent oxidoreductase [Desulfosporosinus sp. BICA1-9]|uniref:NAD-dependent epimerase/dehydratase family protein n=1 Tax=Desulfosporosinus sp. BICA1-9 TaxID=1531958 RepID=UPI00054BD772|nr:NAD(P)H-binding protein [Desulfosporosinus sp. BICA1-9]KJS49021.1 MAG: 3-beta hydroxysteroid dehydrogenase [Peptococcaceae bacterium BRH_c23]KJS90751.1 MAG: 3-beta hydroxysteroid dehydrogenase [Desulfosporosinus sp. BICA1-9]HBW35496.1 3-beta hydroxysteroid dehydrogenase [Desulfosporosinus sp.]
MILLTGATGFLGEFVLNELINRGHDVTCFVRKTSNLNTFNNLNVKYVYGELDDYQSICKALSGKEVLINIASLGFGHAPNIINACKEMNVKRAIFVSTTGVFTKLNPDSKGIRLEAERLIKESGLDYTIIRPTMIYGTPKDRNMWRLVKYLKRLRVLPILGDGTYLQQPVFVKDLATAIVSSYETSVSIKKAYNISGAKPLTYNEIVNTTGRALGKNVIRIHIPMKLSYELLNMYEKVSKKPKLKAEQVLRLNENKDFSHEEATKDFGYRPLSFEEGIKLEINW